MFNKNCFSRLDLLEIRGKRQEVPVRLTEGMKTAMTLLADKGKEVGISSLNPYLFACAGRQTLQAIRRVGCSEEYCPEVC